MVGCWATGGCYRPAGRVHSASWAVCDPPWMTGNETSRRPVEPWDRLLSRHWMMQWWQCRQRFADIGRAGRECPRGHTGVEFANPWRAGGLRQVANKSIDLRWPCSRYWPSLPDCPCTRPGEAAVFHECGWEVRLSCGHCCEPLAFLTQVIDLVELVGVSGSIRCIYVIQVRIDSLGDLTVVPAHRSRVFSK